MIEEELEYIDIPNDFKEKYIEQIPLNEFLINSPKEIANIVQYDYNFFITYKNKSLSMLIKEFVKCSIEKQRKIILLFLISDEESQFTAHIIFDLITDKAFLSESQYLSELLFNSLHWKIQKIFKISNENFENNKNKLESLTINNVSYESRILSLKISEQIKIKASEKLKEINGSKENSIKAQQWLDGFLKIPFNNYKKEPIITFFKNYQNKIEKYIDTFTIKISEYDYNKLNDKNKVIYNIIIQIIDEYHSNIYKSEVSISLFIKYIESIKLAVEYELGNSIIDKNINLITNIIKNKTNNIDDKINNTFLLDNYDDNNVVIDKII